MDLEKSSKKFWPWIVLNLKVGALSVGASARIMIYQDDLEQNKNWLTREDFQEILTLCSILPGPNLVNLVCYLGYQLSSVLGAILGLLALAIPGAFLIVLIWKLFPFENENIHHLFQGFSIGSVLLFSIFIGRLFQGLKSRGFGNLSVSNFKWAVRLLLALIAFSLSLEGFSLVWVILCGIVVCLIVEFALVEPR
jgi:chromate transport protein ChrA